MWCKIYYVAGGEHEHDTHMPDMLWVGGGPAQRGEGVALAVCSKVEGEGEGE